MAKENYTIPSLQYMPGDKFVPHHELQRVTAAHYYHVGHEYEIHQEGLMFDKNGDMYFTDIYEALVRKIDMKTGEMSSAATRTEATLPVYPADSAQMTWFLMQKAEFMLPISAVLRLTEEEPSSISLRI